MVGIIIGFDGTACLIEVLGVVIEWHDGVKEEEEEGFEKLWGRR